MSDWREKAACRGIAHNPDFNPDEDPFYDPPEREDGGDKWEYARALCATCPAARACLEDALTTEGRGGVERHGFRGGHSPHQRKRISLGLPAVAPRKPRPTRTEPTEFVKKQRDKRAEFVQEIEELLDMGLTGREVLRTLNATTRRSQDAVYMRLHRAGRDDLWKRLDIFNTIDEIGA
jgi:hypothetical protein